MVDGIGGSDLMAALFELGPDSPRPVPVPWSPQAGPAVADIVASGALDTVIWPVKQLVDLPGLVRRTLRTRSRTGPSASGSGPNDSAMIPSDPPPSPAPASRAASAWRCAQTPRTGSAARG